jgi:hypothetical protein
VALYPRRRAEHVTLNAGMMPYMPIVIVRMALMCLWLGVTLWPPNWSGPG